MPLDILEKLETDGFVLFEISEKAQESLRSVFDAAYIFFHQPQGEKNLNKLPNDLGFRPYGIEYSKSFSRPDQVESFSVSTRVPIVTSELHSPAARTLCERMLAAFNILEKVAEAASVDLATELSSQATGERLRGAFHSWSLLQLNYSRPAEVTSPFINETHEDGALMTVAYADGPGLELKVQGKKFVPITNTQGNVLVLPGEIAWLLSGGRVRPLYHRVRPQAHCRERLALLLFADIAPGLCEPWIVNEINMNVDIGERVLKNPKRYGLEEWKSE